MFEARGILAYWGEASGGIGVRGSGVRDRCQMSDSRLQIVFLISYICLLTSYICLRADAPDHRNANSSGFVIRCAKLPPHDFEHLMSSRQLCRAFAHVATHADDDRSCALPCVQHRRTRGRRARRGDSAVTEYLYSQRSIADRVAKSEEKFVLEGEHWSAAAKLHDATFAAPMPSGFVG